MKPIYSKFFNTIIIFIFLVSLLSVSTVYTNANSQANNRQQILAIYDSETLSLVQTLHNDRMKIDNASLNVTYINIQNSSLMNSLINNQNINQKYDEVWIVSNKISDFKAQINQLITQVMSYNLPLFIWSSEICALNQSTLIKLGISSCSSDPSQYGNSTLSYANQNNLSSLLNLPLPSLKSISGNIEASDIQLNSNAYGIINLTTNFSTPVNPIVPILFQPLYKSNILIASFKLDEPSLNNITTTTTDTSSDTSSLVNAQVNEGMSSILSQGNVLSLETLANVNQLSIANLVSALTYGIRFDWSSTSNLGSILTGGTNPTGSVGPIGILQTGFNFPTISPQLATNVAIGTTALGLLGLLIVFLKRYWIYILGLFIGIFAVFKVPSRKISVMDVYHNETRQNIIDILNYKKSQGETVRNLSRELQIPLPTLLWHLQILEEFELIVKEKVKREIVVIAMDYVDDFNLELKIFEMTFKSEKAKIFYDYLLNLRQGEVFTITSVVNHTSWSARTVIRYISKLLELQIIEQNPNGKGYKITQDYYSKLKELV